MCGGVEVLNWHGRYEERSLKGLLLLLLAGLAGGVGFALLKFSCWTCLKVPCAWPLGQV